MLLRLAAGVTRCFFAVTEQRSEGMYLGVPND
jgi:hypothetical protein